MKTPSTYWFPAKRYGWGWGFPVTWQGWAVLAAFVALFGAGLLAFPPGAEIRSLLIYGRNTKRA